MTDEEFVEELATRLNLFIDVDEQRSLAVLTTPLMQAGYANVGHFLGQLCCPRGITDASPPEQLANVKFLMPVLKKGRITSFRAVTGTEIQEKVREAAEAAHSARADDADDPKIH